MADNLMGNIPLELQPEMQNISQQQKLSQLLLQQGFQQPQGQMVSGHYVKPSIFQNLQPLLAAYAGSKGMETAEQKQLELAKAIRQGKMAAEQSIINKMEGTPAQATELAGPYTEKVPMPIAVQPGKAPDLAGALREISTNQYGAGKEFAPTILKQLHPEKPSSVLEFEYAKEHPELLPYLMNKASAGANKISLEVANQLPYKQQMQKEAATGLMKNFETLQNIPSTLQNMDKLVKLSQQPIYAGVGGETKLQTAKFLNNNFGTNIGTDKIGNSEEFKAAAYQGILENLKKTDSNPTLQQQNALKEALGSLGTDPSALPRVVNVMRDVLITKAKQHNDLVQQTILKGIEYPYSIEIPLPKVNPNVSSGNVQSAADAILNRKPGISQ